MHGDQTQVVLLVDPHQELLVGGVEDATAVGPVIVAAGGPQEPVNTAVHMPGSLHARHQQLPAALHARHQLSRTRLETNDCLRLPQRNTQTQRSKR